MNAERRTAPGVSTVPENAALGIALFILATIAFFSYREWDRFRTASDEVQRASEILRRTHLLVSAMKDAETGQRGYLLTGDRHYLAPYNEALSTIPQEIAQLRRATSYVLISGEYVRRAEALAKAKLQELQQIVDLQNHGQLKAAMEVVKSRRDRKTMTALREVCDQIDSLTYKHLIEGTNAAEESRHRTRVLSLGGSGIMFALLALTTVTIHRGTSRRQQLIRDLHTSEQRTVAARDLLDTTLCSISDGVIATDAQARVIFMNPVARELTGWTEGDEARGRPLNEILIILDENSRTAVESPAYRALREGSTAGLSDHVLARRNGTEFPVETSAAPLRDAAGKVIGSVLVLRDVTERRRVEKEKADLIEALRRSNEDLHDFAHAASHDLRSPLRTVQQMTGILAAKFRGKLDEDTEEIMGFITSGTKRMDTLIADLLEFSSARRVEHLEPVPASRALQGALVNLKTTIEESGAAIESGALPTVMAPETQLMQLFQNLIANAIKYQRERPVRVEIWSERRGSQCVFAVRDNGIGIDPKYANEIFRPFRRLHGTEYPGSGIGLATCKKLVEHYGGRIWVESEPGRGSTFFFSLPAATGAGTEEQDRFHASTA